MSGQALRSLAMYHAGSNFTHTIAETKVHTHKLVTSGVYAFSRHPSYCGWYWWSVGTQILMGNPVCVLAYSVYSWHFFRARISYEEYHLETFFGQAYRDYKAKVGSGIPFLP